MHDNDRQSNDRHPYDKQPQGEFLKTLLKGIIIAALVSVPFWVLQKPDLTGPVVFAEARHQAGDVREVKCPFRLRRDKWVTCYRIYTKQNRQQTDGPLISSFAVMIDPVGGATLDDPFIYLDGGPGYAGVPVDEQAYGRDGWVRESYQGVLETGRALIFIDTRGLGLSEPSLQCPHANAASWQALKLTPAERATEADISPEIACLEALKRAGVAPRDYHSGNVALDLKALREGLGIAQWNIYGVSYGAQTALHLLEVDKGGVRSAIFDSPAYGRNDVLQGDQASFDRALDLVAAYCADEVDPGWCDGREQQGDIKDRLAALLIRLREDPLTLRGYPFGKPLYLTDREAMLILHGDLYSSYGREDFVSDLVEMEDRTSGYFQSLSQWSMDWRDDLYWSYLDDSFSLIVHLATVCRETKLGPPIGPSRWPVYSPKEEENERLLCDAMETSYRGEMIDARQFRDVPALIFSGNLDVITPPAYGAALAKDIKGTWFFHETEAHGVLFWSKDECVGQAALSFLATPERVKKETCEEHYEKAA